MPTIVAVQVRQVSVWCEACGGSLVAETVLAELWLRGHLRPELDAMLVSINGGPLLWWRLRKSRISA